MKKNETKKELLNNVYDINNTVMLNELLTLSDIIKQCENDITAVTDREFNILSIVQSILQCEDSESIKRIKCLIIGTGLDDQEKKRSA